uniref:Cytochrome P450 n=1 Tax=Cannabis sativa TaxID=3483 RepID=A0A803PHV8_CANSA
MKPFLQAKIITLLTLFSFGFILYQTPWPFTLFLSILFSFVYSFLNRWLVPGGFAWSKSNHRFSKLKGPMGWPILGTIPEMGPLAHRKLANLAASFDAKRVMALSLGFTPVIISSHPETAKEILGGSSFTDRPIKDSARLLMFERAIGFAPAGTYWRHLRRVAAVHMFSPRRIATLEGLRQRVADEMLARVGQEMDERGVVVGLRGILQKGSLTNVLESVFGSRLGLENQAGQRLGDMVNEGYELISKFNLEDYFPLKFLDFFGVKRKCNILAAKVNDVVSQIVKERKISFGTIITTESETDDNDFLSALLALPKEDQLSDSDMVAILWEMIFRGTDTVAILLEWIMARMVLHQDMQEKVQHEIDTCVGNNRHVRETDIPNLPYLQAIVKEVLRLHPPGPLLSWARLAVHDVHIDKHFIPAGTTAMVNMWAITHDPSIWKDPWAFRPERFMEEDVTIMGSDLRLAPFGSGRRVCPGKALGLATVHLWLARLLHQYKWLPAQPVDLSECLRLSMEMKKPVACHVAPRLNNACP